MGDNNTSDCTEVNGKTVVRSLFCDLSKYFDDDFMGLVTSFRSYWMEHLIHFVNYGHSKSQRGWHVIAEKSLDIE